MKQLQNKEIWLSASRLKTLDSCTYLYYCKYILKLEGEQNDGSRRGTLTHTIFEYLSKPKHRNLYNQLVKEKTIKKIPALLRLTKRLMKSLRLGEIDNKDQDNFQLIDEMVVFGLTYDFFCEGMKLYDAESEIKIENDKIKVIGYIDKLAEKDNVLHIIDFKSSSKNTEDHSLQALTYALWAKRVKKMDSVVKFIFLRFPDDPVRQFIFNESALAGFEYYLNHIYKKLQNFTEEDAVSKMAVNNKEKRWLCGFNKREGQLTKAGKIWWGCEMKWPFDYYALLDINGKVIKTSRSNSLIPKDGEKIEKRHFAGCPAHNRRNNDF